MRTLTLVFLDAEHDAEDASDVNGEKSSSSVHVGIAHSLHVNSVSRIGKVVIGSRIIGPRKFIVDDCFIRHVADGTVSNKFLSSVLLDRKRRDDHTKQHSGHFERHAECSSRIANLLAIGDEHRQAGEGNLVTLFKNKASSKFKQCACP